VVFLPHGSGYALADSITTAQTEPVCDPLHDPRFGDRYASATVGTARSDAAPQPTVTLCGGYRLEPSRAHPLLHDLPEVVHLRAHVGQHPELRATVDLLGSEIDNPRLGADAVVPALLDMLLLFALRAWFDERAARDAPAGWSRALADPAIGATLDAVHRDCAHPWTVAPLATLAGLSRAAFAQRFTPWSTGRRWPT
jgi:hypothetical protein